MRMVTPVGSLALLAVVGFAVAASAQRAPSTTGSEAVPSPVAVPRPTASGPEAAAAPAAAPRPAASGPEATAAPAAAPTPALGVDSGSQKPVAPPGAAPVDGAVSGEEGSGAAESTDRPPVFVAKARPRPRAVPADHPIALFLDLESHWNGDPGYAVFSRDDTVPRWGFGLSYDLVDVAPNTTIVPEIGFRRERAVNGDVYSNELQAAELGAWDLLGAVSVRYRHFSWLGAHARAQVGASATTVSFGDDRGTRFEDSSWAPFAGLGAGIDLERSVSRKVSFGLVVEGGYVGALAPEYDLVAKNDPDDDAILIREASLGDLSRSGPYLRFAGLIRF